MFPSPEESLTAFYQVKQALARGIAPVLQREAAELTRLMERPKDSSRGHLALPVFPFCRELKKSPPSLAKEWSEKLQKQAPDFVEETQAASGFINFRLRLSFIQQRLSKLFERRFAQSAPDTSRKTAPHWVVDFASPNVAKNMNAGHLRAGAVGQALINTARFFGVKATAVNHLGDWGTQFGKLLWAYKKWGGEMEASRTLASAAATVFADADRFSAEKSAAEAAAEAGAETRRREQKTKAGAASRRAAKLPEDLARKMRAGADRLPASLLQASLLQASLAQRQAAAEKLTVDDLAALYTRFHAEETAERRAEAARLFQKLEAGDKELHSLWKVFVDISLKNYEFYWKKLNIKHDLVLGESFYRNEAAKLKERLKEKGLLQKSQGAEAVFLEEGEPPCLIEKSDGASTYGARDISAAFYRQEKLKADLLIYITGAEQKLHFKQIFKVLEKAGFKIPCLHITFGIYRFKGGGKLSSRKGGAVYLKDLLKEAKARAAKIMENRGAVSHAFPQQSEADKERVAEQVGTGALIFNDLMTDRSKDVEFDWDKALDLSGRSGPFVQYTYVRCGSLIRKYKEKRGREPPDRFPTEDALSKEEAEAAWRLLYFDEAAYQSFVKLKPHLLAAYLLDLAKQFNRFYAEERILDSPKEAVRVLLANKTRKALKQGLSLLNMPLPETM